VLGVCLVEIYDQIWLVIVVAPEYCRALMVLFIVALLGKTLVIADSFEK
jgi:hypothetical protein